MKMEPIEKDKPKKETEKKEDDGYLSVDYLPTKYKLYSKGTLIKARALKILEVKMLSSLNESNANYVINDVLRRCIRGIELEDLYVADKIYLLYFLRANTFKDSSYKVEFQCPKCEKSSNYNFELDVLKIHELGEEEFKQIGKPVKTPSGHELTFNTYLTIREEEEIQQFLKDNEKSMMKFDEEILSLCKMIEKIDGQEKGLIQKYMFVTEDLTAPDFSFIRGHIEKIGVGLDPYVTAKCNECSGKSQLLLPFDPSFFFPTSH